MLVARPICLYEFEGDKNILDGISRVYVTHRVSVTYHVQVEDVGKVGHELVRQ